MEVIGLFLVFYGDNKFEASRYFDGGRLIVSLLDGTDVEFE